MRYHLLPLCCVALAACKEEVAQAPLPVAMTEEALAYYCQMNISEHPGPKGQVHLEGMPGPIFFAQVRDLVAFIKSPERTADVTAIYVSDMALAASWDDIAPDNWVAVKDAQFVINADVAGGMGAPEIVPFSAPEAAADFIESYGGEVVEFDVIPDNAALGEFDLETPLETPS